MSSPRILLADECDIVGPKSVSSSPPSTSMSQKRVAVLCEGVTWSQLLPETRVLKGKNP